MESNTDCIDFDGKSIKLMGWESSNIVYGPHHYSRFDIDAEGHLYYIGYNNFLIQRKNGSTHTASLLNPAITQEAILTFEVNSKNLVQGNLSFDIREKNQLIREYNYDSNGNRLSLMTANNTITATHDDQDRLKSYGIYQYEYTNSGNLKTRLNTQTKATNQYRYDSFGNLRQAILSNNTTIDYLIDGRHRRIGKKVNGQLKQGFLYQDQLNPVAELDQNGDVVSLFIYAEKINVPSYMVKNDRTYRIISNHLGSPVLVMDVETGNIEQKITYNEFGQILTDSNLGFQPFGFAGGIYDRDTKLTRFGARDYDAYVGRWTAKDPIGFDDGTNLYAYVHNDPVNFLDLVGTTELPTPPFSDDKLSPLNKEQLQELYDAHKDQPSERRKIREIQKRKGFRGSSLKRKWKKLKIGADPFTIFEVIQEMCRSGTLVGPGCLPENRPKNCPPDA